MPDDKVVRFPGSIQETPEPATPKLYWQPDLFGNATDNCGKIAFLDIGWLVEETLFNLVTRNAVTALVDLRPRPVFDRPRFRHKNVVHYLHVRNVFYLEYATLARSKLEAAKQFRYKPEGAAEKIGVILRRGLTICVYDDASKTAGWMDEIRHLLRHSPEFNAEMHPRTLIGTLNQSSETNIEPK